MEQTEYRGLTPAQVEDSRAKNGNNLITPAKKTSMWRLFFEKFNDPIIRILIAAAVVSLGISLVEGGFEEPIGIFSAIILATGISFYFERDASKKFEILTKVNDDNPVRVMRDGKITEIPKRDIVVGDIIMIEAGDEIPADGLLLKAMSLQIDESTLTGELMIEKTVDPEDFDKEATYPSNMVLRGTAVLDGHGIMQVEKVGDATQYGQVAKNATRTVEEETPLNRQLTNLAGLISGVAVVLGVFTFFIMVLKEIQSAPIGSVTTQHKIMLTSLLVFLMIAMSRVFLPAILRTLSIFKIKAEKLNKLCSRSWTFFTILALVVAAIIYVGVSLFTGFVSPLSSEAWLDVNIIKHIVDAFMVAVTLIVVVVPEGLPMSITLSLALNMRRMLKTNNLVRKIHASETMGATTVICTDKTGTLTQNRMSVEYLKLFATTGGNIDNSENSRIFTEGIATNTTAQLGTDVNGNTSALGNPTEGALLNFLRDNSVDYRPLRNSVEVHKQLTFSTQRKYMATLVRSAVTGANMLYLKGAPEIITGKCTSVLTPSGVDAIDGYRGGVSTELAEFQNKAMRTLAFAYKNVADDDNRPIEELAESGLIFLGFVAISDPIRQDVPAAVQRCINAGVKVKIVTGDTSATAREIGRQIGIWCSTDTDENIIAGSDFEALSDEEAFERAKKLKIMCRARPTDKQRLVQLLQKAGEVVAVTGDGTNDAPALNQAHVGLSMGTGTAV
ncbi:MAG: HAD-IC family P-type ATPase, partial [Bacteroidales bacterium]